MIDLEAQFGHLTDKFSLDYFSAYEELLSGRKDPAILEIGVAYGGSILLWQALFPDSVIVGVDIVLPSIAGNLIQADQRDPDLVNKVAVYSDSYDLIIDDACHVGGASQLTFAHLWPLVRPGGWYVLEDWTVGLKSSPYYPLHDNDSMLRLAQAFTEDIQPVKDIRDMGGSSIPGGRAGSVSEVRYKYGMAMVHKTTRSS